jgi:MFS family permease
MADINEKTGETAPDVPVAVTQAVPNDHVDEEPTNNAGRPKGWKYREIKIGPLTIPWYASPKTQLTMVAFVCFMCPGMFNALGGLGGGGKADATTADNMVNAPNFSEIRKVAPQIANYSSV